MPISKVYILLVLVCTCFLLAVINRHQAHIIYILTSTVQNDLHKGFTGKLDADSVHTIRDIVNNAVTGPNSNYGLQVLSSYYTPNTSAININTTMAEAEANFVKQAEQLHVKCPDIKRVGLVIDGGWDICITGPYQPRSNCLVYSFGINYDFSFDNAMALNYNCTVRSYDPTMNQKQFIKTTAGSSVKMSDLVTFYKTGLGGRDQVSPSSGWVVRTLKSLLESNQETNTIMDVLKIDIEYSEWTALSAILEDGSLRNVKQFVLEIHSPETFRHLPVATIQDYLEMHDILSDLELLGFRKYFTHLNPYCKDKKSRVSGKITQLCYEMSYLNLAFLNQNDSY